MLRAMCCLVPSVCALQPVVQAEWAEGPEADSDDTPGGGRLALFCGYVTGVREGLGLLAPHAPV